MLRGEIRRYSLLWVKGLIIPKGLLILLAWVMENSKGKKRGGLKNKREKKKKKKRKEWKNDGGWEVKVCPPQNSLHACSYPPWISVHFLSSCPIPWLKKRELQRYKNKCPFTNFTYDYFPHIIVITIGQLIKCFPCQVLGKCLVGINWHNTHPKFQTEVLRSPVGGRVRLCQSLLYQPTSK